MRAGASDFVVKDQQRAYLDLLPTVVNNVLLRRSNELELEAYRQDLEQLADVRTAQLHDRNRELTREVEELIRSKCATWRV